MFQNLNDFYFNFVIYIVQDYKFVLRSSVIKILQRKWLLTKEKLSKKIRFSRSDFRYF